MSAVLKRTIIYFFRNDLRFHDNECLQWACRNADHVIPLYCFDPNHYKGTHHFGFSKTGKHRSKFLIDCVKDLRCTLQKHGSNLIVRQEKVTSAIHDLVKLCSTVAPVYSVVFQREVTKEETDVEAEVGNFCKEHGIEVKSFWGSTLYHPEDLPFSPQNTPDTYTAFRKRVENIASIRPLICLPDLLKKLPPVKGQIGDIPTMSDLGIKELSNDSDKRSAFKCSGGETSALERLDDYLWKTDAVATYKKTRNGLIGQDYSTKFSPWLSSGSLSPRKIFNDIKRYESERAANESTYWVIFELIWRDYFKFVCWKYGDGVFYQSGIMGKKIKWKNDMTLFEKWSQGQTGIPFVDANMREMLETGWMSNRGRQNVASFLVKDLGLDWRLGAEWFESLLIDHDVCSNYGNWNYAAGIGNDPRQDRKFNMIKQAMDYDGDGEFVRLWVPELAKLPGGDIHVPWSLPVMDLRAAEVALGSSYPRPVVIAPEWGKHKHKKGPKCAGEARTQRGQRGIDFYFKSGSQKR